MPKMTKNMYKLRFRFMFLRKRNMFVIQNLIASSMLAQQQNWFLSCLNHLREFMLIANILLPGMGYQGSVRSGLSPFLGDSSGSAGEFRGGFFEVTIL